MIIIARNAALHCVRSQINRCVVLLRAVHTKEEKPRWEGVVNEAEKIVGYPTSFLNLRWLLSDEIANVAFHLKKLMGTDHPVLKTAKSLLVNNDKPSWGLVVLLVSKAGGLKKSFLEVEHDRIAGILHSQRSLAEVTEMITTGIKLHKSVTSTSNSSDMNYGNKIALLSGDYLLSNSYHALACLKNPELNELMASALRDLAECEFFGDKDEQNEPLPGKPQKSNGEVWVGDEMGTEPMNIQDVLGNARAEWTLRSLLGGGSLLGKSCQGAFLLAGHSLEQQKQAYLFGKHLALAWQASHDINSFLSSEAGAFDLVSAPVLFHLQHDPVVFELIEKGRRSVCDVDYQRLWKLVAEGPALELSKDLKSEHCNAALEVLNNFMVRDARQALSNMINAM